MKEKVVVFGVGAKFNTLYAQIKKKYEIVALVDNNISGFIKGFEVKRIEDIINLDYDKILILPNNAQVEIKNKLQNYGIKEKTCIPYNGDNKVVTDSDFSFDHDIIKFNNGKIKMEIINPSTLSSVRGIFVSNIYNILGIDEKMIVIDIGMNIGAATLFFAANDKVNKVYGFEPFKENFIQAEKNINLNTEEIRNKIDIFNMALSNYDEVMKMKYNNKASICMSIVNNDIYTENSKEEIIEIRDAGNVLNPIIKKHSHNKIVMKIDCEGSEYAIFKSLDLNDLIKYIDIFLIEWHLEDNEILENFLNKNKYYYIKTNQENNYGMLYAFKCNK